MDGFFTVTEVAAGPCSAAEATLVRPGKADRFRTRVSPPPPDTVVVASPGHAVALVQQARASEAALRAEHAAEVARLADALRQQAEAHAAEVERLRAEHAAESRRLVEAHWRARDAARTGGLGEGSDPGPEARSPARPPDALRWLARITRRG